MLGILLGVISLGWVGLALFALSNIVAVLVWSCVLAFRVEANLAPAVTADQPRGRGCRNYAERFGECECGASTGMLDAFITFYSVEPQTSEAA